MSTLISELGQVCAGVPGLGVQVQLADMLVTVPLSNGRTQTVKVWSASTSHGSPPVIRMQSRAALVRNYKVVRDALYLNAGAGGAGFALDRSVNPPALDVMSSIIADPTELPVQDFLNALYAVAVLADEVEAKLGAGQDHF